MPKINHSLRSGLVERARNQNIEELKLNSLVTHADKSALAEALSPLSENPECELRSDLKSNEALFLAIIRNLSRDYGDAQDMSLEALIAQDLDESREKIVQSLLNRAVLFLPREVVQFHLENALEEAQAGLTSILFEAVSDATPLAFGANVEPSDSQLNELLALDIQRELAADGLGFYAAHVITLEDLEIASTLTREELMLIVRNNLLKNSRALVSSYLSSLSEREAFAISGEISKISGQQDHFDKDLGFKFVRNILAKRRLDDLPKIEKRLWRMAEREI